MPITAKFVEERLREANVSASPDQISRLAGYADLLERWNAKMNLTSLDAADVALDRLIVEPVLASREIRVAAGVLVDVGSGGGSPAIPLKIMCPRLRLTMVEVKTRKSVFLREALRHVAIDDAEVRTGRFEDVLQAPDLRGRIDVLSLRAVRVDADHMTLLDAALAPSAQALWFLSRSQYLPELPPTLGVEKRVSLVARLGSELALLGRNELRP